MLAAEGNKTWPNLYHQLIVWVEGRASPDGHCITFGSSRRSKDIL